MKHSIDIKDFHDFREFLKTSFGLQQKQQSTWSLSSWAKFMKLKDTSSLTKILNAQRLPGPAMTETFINYFRFNQRDAQYFRDLIALEKNKGNAQLNLLLRKQIKRLCNSQSEKILDEATFSLLSQWHHLAIREMVKLKDFQFDVKWIAKRLNKNVGIKAIKASLEVLMTKGLVKLSETGSLLQSEGKVYTSDDIKSLAIRSYHKESLDFAKEQLELTEVSKREFNSSVICLDLNKLEKAKLFIREFKQEFCQEYDEAQGDEIYQIQIQFFPVTKKESL